MTDPDLDLAADALRPAIEELQAATIDTLRNVIASELSLCARDAALIDRFLIGARDTHRAPCRITPGGWCAEHSTANGPAYCQGKPQ